ncbi:MAG: hypothetical protein V3U10_04250, partial [Bacteroidota bacterium]
FPRVALGLELQAAVVIGGQEFSRRFRGPTSAGESVRIELAPDASCVLLTARVIDERDRPIAERKLLVDLERGYRHILGSGSVSSKSPTQCENTSKSR